MKKQKSISQTIVEQPVLNNAIMMEAPHLVIIGSSCRNSGKTTLAAGLIEQLKEKMHVIALKITSIDGRSASCPHGSKGCGACSLSGVQFALTEEICACGEKDTSRLLAAGAEKVFWLRCLKQALFSGFTFFQEQSPHNAVIICESNCLREIVNPAVFIMIDNPAEIFKPSAKRVAALADISIRYPWNENSARRLFKQVEDALTQKNSGASGCCPAPLVT
ncbi:MAG: hypothetical protein LBD07_05180 [Spirochaetaceae bacterium]|jgi:hypothetical protein|nr:hypothetical protein [Spirochaetaceae bacterium]